jgi:hypothetical protein
MLEKHPNNKQISTDFRIGFVIIYTLILKVQVLENHRLGLSVAPNS